MSDKKHEGYYTSAIPNAEVERLRNFAYPDTVSIEVLGDVHGKKVLDAGAGARSKLGEWLNQQGGEYIAFDLAPEMIASIKKTASETGMNFEGVRGRIEQLPFSDESVDVAHTRFVLMHLPAQERKIAVKELLRVAREKVHLLEFNWGTVTSEKNPNEIEEFKNLFGQFADMTHAYLQTGAEVGEIARSVTPGSHVEVRHFERQEDDYTIEIIPLLKMATAKLDQWIHGEDQTFIERFGLDRLTNLKESFEDFATRVERKPIQFVPPEIVVATIEKNKFV